jgi:hypothetical protein
MEGQVSEPIKLTDEQVRTLEANYQKLFDDARAQLEEHKTWLEWRLSAYYDQKPEAFKGYDFLQLLAQTRNLKLGFVRQEEGLKETKPGQPEADTISIAYDYDDELFDFLSKADLPEDLSLFKQGGILVSADTPLTTIPFYEDKRSLKKRGN